MNKILHHIKMFTDEEYQKEVETALKLQEVLKNQENLLSLKLPIEKQIPSCLNCRFCEVGEPYKGKLERGYIPRYFCKRPLNTAVDYDYIKGSATTRLYLNYKQCFEERTKFYDSSFCCGQDAIFFMKKEEEKLNNE